MKILYICPDLGIPVLGRKGAAVHVRELTGSFIRAGHSVILACQMLNKSPWEKPAEVPFPVLQVRPNASAQSAVLGLKAFNERLKVENSLPGELRRILYNQELEAELFRRFENDPPDLIYERASLYATAGIGLGKSLNVPLFLEVNAPLADEQTTYRATGFGELAAQAERWTLGHADAVLVVSSELKRHAVSMGAAAERVHVLPNGVNPALFHPAPADPELRASLGLNGGPVLGFVGGLRPWHGVEVLPELLERLSGRYTQISLVVAGDGPLRKVLQTEADKRGLGSKLLVTGLVPHEQIPALIRQFDIALAPYPKAEHSFYFSPLKVFEYMACGVPVVAARLGQINEVINDGRNGLLYPAGDLDALTRRCDKLLANRKLRTELGRAAAHDVQDRHTWDHNARTVVDLFRAFKAPKSCGATGVAGAA